MTREKIEEYKIDEHIERKYIKSLIPLFISKGGIKYSGFGTGIYLEYNKQYYIVTAAHIINEYKCLFYPCDPTYIAGLPIKNAITSQEIDLGICKLVEPLTSFFYPYQLCFNESSLKYTDYVCCGYPETKFKQFTSNKGVEIKEEHFKLYTSILNNDNPSDLKINEHYEIAVKYGRKLINESGQNITATVPNGMSGGMLIGYRIDDSDSICSELVGVLTRYDATNWSAMIATNSSYIKIMLDKYEECEQGYTIQNLNTQYGVFSLSVKNNLN